MINFQEIANTFNTSLQEEADPWIKWHSNLKSWVDEAVYKVSRIIGAQQNKRLLDVATGTGDNVLLLSKIYPNCSFKASDISSIYIEKAKENSKSKAINSVEFSISDVHNLVYKNSCYDIVTCFFSFMYFKDVHLATQELLRVTKPKGKIIITTWTGDNILFNTITKLLFNNDDKIAYPDAKNPNLFSDETKLLKIFNQNGLSNVTIERHPMHIKWHGSSKDFWTFFKESNSSVVKELNSLSILQRKEKEQKILESILLYESNDILSIPTSILISTLTK
ncbi:class I SAM-dependent methyltransferase [Tenacibaculum amylolyticum]|uniref:class I SAM-dependent methyltransferase n=1 Tax=Tenacibaculum amylolyticum TaxID=104269 RepID=UPI003893335F